MWSRYHRTPVRRHRCRVQGQSLVCGLAGQIIAMRPLDKLGTIDDSAVGSNWPMPVWDSAGEHAVARAVATAAGMPPLELEATLLSCANTASHVAEALEVTGAALAAVAVGADDVPDAAAAAWMSARTLSKDRGIPGGVSPAGIGSPQSCCSSLTKKDALS